LGRVDLYKRKALETKNIIPAREKKKKIELMVSTVTPTLKYLISPVINAITPKLTAHEIDSLIFKLLESVSDLDKLVWEF